MDWEKLHSGTAEDAANFFVKILWYSICKFIPYKEVTMKKKSHPWINAACERAIATKNASEGNPSFEEKRRDCTRVLSEEYQKYLVQLKEKIAGLKKGSKEWWKLNRELLHRKTKCSSIPPLRHDNMWVHESKEKANIFVKNFESKARLPEEEIDCPFWGKPDVQDENFVTLRSRTTFKILSKFDESKATGPHKIPATILKK